MQQQAQPGGLEYQLKAALEDDALCCIACGVRVYMTSAFVMSQEYY
jgi:hypothetical protein